MLQARFIRSQNAIDLLEACRCAVEKHFGSLVTSVPRNPEDLASQVQIPVRRTGAMPFDGCLEREGDGSARITIKRSLNQRRERFTVAHELGHWLLQEELLGAVEGRLFRGLSATSDELGEEEYLANLLAAEILMPVEPLRDAVEASGGRHFISRVCARFGVSRMAAVRRIADVCGKNLVLLQIVPYRLRDTNSCAEIDDAIFASSGVGTLFDRDRTRLLFRGPFRMLASAKNVDLTVDSIKGRIEANFDIESRQTPIPTVFAVSVLERWPEQC